MSPQLRTLVAAALASAIGGGVVVYSYRDAATTFVDLQNAGIGTDCNNRLIVCSERVNPVLRNRLADAGTPLPAQRKYARIVRQAFNCANPDGGVRELIVPGFERFSATNDETTIPEPTRCIDRPCADFPNFCGNGPKNVALMSGAPDCVRAPVGNVTCRRDEHDGGSRFFGEMNVFPVGDAVGAGCEGVDCAVMFGDNPDTSL